MLFLFSENNILGPLGANSVTGKFQGGEQIFLQGFPSCSCARGAALVTTTRKDLAAVNQGPARCIPTAPASQSPAQRFVCRFSRCIASL